MDEREIEEVKNKYKKRRKRRIIIIVIVLVLLLLSVVFALINIFNDKVINGVTIDNIKVAGKTKSEISEQFNDLIEKNKKKDIILKYNEAEIVIKPEELDVKYNISNAVDNAYLTGRDSNVFINNFNICKSFILKTNIEIQMTYDEQKLNAKINEISKKIPGFVQQYAYCIEEDNLIITKGKPGIDIKQDKLKELIEKELRNYEQDKASINIPTYNADPKKIDLDVIYKEIHKEPKDAYIEHDPLVVHPHVNGVDFAISMEEAKNIIKEDKEEYSIPLKITVPEKTLANLGEDAFPDLLGEYTTWYNNGNYNRSNNVKLASQKIDGTVVMPGEVFSYNQTVGRRTEAAGFLPAGAYVGGQVVDEVGGGICQVSSTLYNAVLYANLEIVERENHMFEASYVPISRDATVSWGSCDFKFRNNRKYPIKISTSSYGGRQEVCIYGIKEENEPEVIITSETLEYFGRDTIYIDDDSMYEGEEEIEETGHDGCRGAAYKILKRDGEVISSETISYDTYDSLAKTIRRGTKKYEAPSETPSTPVEPEPEPQNPGDNPEESGGQQGEQTSGGGESETTGDSDSQSQGDSQDSSNQITE